MDLADRLEIVDLVNRYGHVYDEGHLDRLGELFTADAVFEFRPGVAGMPDVLRGRDDIVEHMTQRYRSTRPAQRRHLITNVTLFDGGEDRVHAACYLLLASTTDGVLSLPITGRYEDVVVRDGTAWRFAQRVLTFDAALA